MEYSLSEVPAPGLSIQFCLKQILTCNLQSATCSMLIHVDFTGTYFSAMVKIVHNLEIVNTHVLSRELFAYKSLHTCKQYKSNRTSYDTMIEYWQEENKDKLH